jgi:hypothetical protein
MYFQGVLIVKEKRIMYLRDLGSYLTILFIWAVFQLLVLRFLGGVAWVYSLILTTPGLYVYAINVVELQKLRGLVYKEPNAEDRFHENVVWFWWVVFSTGIVILMFVFIWFLKVV